MPRPRSTSVAPSRSCPISRKLPTTSPWRSAWTAWCGTGRSPTIKRMSSTSSTAGRSTSSTSSPSTRAGLPRQRRMASRGTAPGAPAGRVARVGHAAPVPWGGRDRSAGQVRRRVLAGLAAPVGLAGPAASRTAARCLPTASSGRRAGRWEAPRGSRGSSRCSTSRRRSSSASPTAPASSSPRGMCSPTTMSSRGPPTSRSSIRRIGTSNSSPRSWPSRKIPISRCSGSKGSRPSRCRWPRPCRSAAPRSWSSAIPAARRSAWN